MCSLNDNRSPKNGTTKPPRSANPSTSPPPPNIDSPASATMNATIHPTVTMPNQTNQPFLVCLRR